MYAIELTPEHPIDRLAAFGVAAEDRGFDAVLVSHHYNNRDQFQALAAIAGATDSVTVGPAVANPYETHPVTLASRMATLDEAAGGRGVFGIGPGDRSTLRNLGIDRDRPLRRVLESFRVARRLWDGERVDHDGTFRADDAGLNYDAGDVPVYVGAQGPHMVRMAAKHADGVLFNGAHPDDLAWAAERVAEGRSGRPADDGVEGDGGLDDGAGEDGDADVDGTGEDGDADVDLLAYALTSVAESTDAARSAARMPLAFVVGGAPEPVLDRHGLDVERAEEIGDHVSAGEFHAAAGAVSDAMLDAFCIAGTPTAVRDRVDALEEYADGVVFASPLGPDVETAIELLGAEFGDEQ